MEKRILLLVGRSASLTDRVPTVDVVFTFSSTEKSKFPTSCGVLSLASVTFTKRVAVLFLPVCEPFWSVAVTCTIVVKIFSYHYLSLHKFICTVHVCMMYT